MFALVAIALASNLSLLLDAAGTVLSPAPQSCDIAQYQDRFAGVRADTPKDAVLGYLTDVDSNRVGAVEEYYLAEYALIPRVIANNTDQKLAIANIHKPQPPEFYQSRGFDLVKDYGNGVLLLRKAAR